MGITAFRVRFSDKEGMRHVCERDHAGIWIELRHLGDTPLSGKPSYKAARFVIADVCIPSTRRSTLAALPRYERYGFLVVPTTSRQPQGIRCSRRPGAHGASYARGPRPPGPAREANAQLAAPDSTTQPNPAQTAATPTLHLTRSALGRHSLTRLWRPLAKLSLSPPSCLTRSALGHHLQTHAGCSPARQARRRTSEPRETLVSVDARNQTFATSQRALFHDESPRLDTPTRKTDHVAPTTELAHNGLLSRPQRNRSHPRLVSGLAAKHSGRLSKKSKRLGHLPGLVSLDENVSGIESALLDDPCALATAHDLTAQAEGVTHKARPSPRNATRDGVFATSPHVQREQTRHARVTRMRSRMADTLGIC